MTPRKTLSRLALASAAAAAISAPAAGARPADAPGTKSPVAPDPGPPVYPTDPQGYTPAERNGADDGGSDWTVPVLTLAGAGLLLGGVGATRVRVHGSRRRASA